MTEVQLAKTLQMELVAYKSVEKGSTELLTLGQVFRILTILNISPEEIIPL